MFIRHSGGVIPTQAGKKFLRHARQALNEIAHAAANVGPIGRGDEGLVRVGIFSSLASGFPTCMSSSVGWKLFEDNSVLWPNDARVREASVTANPRLPYAGSALTGGAARQAFWGESRRSLHARGLRPVSPKRSLRKLQPAGRISASRRAESGPILGHRVLNISAKTVIRLRQECSPIERFKRPSIRQYRFHSCHPSNVLPAVHAIAECPSQSAEGALSQFTHAKASSILIDGLS